MENEYSPIPELNHLRQLEDQLEGMYISEGFELKEYGDTSGVEAGWSNDPAFLDRLIPFAQANHSGSTYAIWKVDDRSDLSALPIVVFGDEGEEHVVARNLRELLQLLGFDAQIAVWKGVCFVRDDDYEPSDGHEEYVAWLDRHLGVEPSSDTESVIAAAQAELAEKFASWIRPFLPHP